MASREEDGSFCITQKYMEGWIDSVRLSDRRTIGKGKRGVKGFATLEEA
jgi:hypothetical protein